MYFKFIPTDNSNVMRADVCFSISVCLGIGEEIGNGEQGGPSLTGTGQTVYMV